MKRHEEIQKLAYDLFEKSGRTHGREIDHWLEAERMIRAREMDRHTMDVEASALKKHVPRSDVRRHEMKKTVRAKKTTK
ncbi:MAG TPA: DUF2934 domain-containing protein [Thermodesulfovibrionales bacterium]|nr:DUF2934 domain-containing protein [Thermodesulfovibrionales bacterium]